MSRVRFEIIDEGDAPIVRASLPAAFFVRLQRQAPADMPEFFSTHPDTGRRIAELRRQVAALPEGTVEPLAIDGARVQASLEQ